jgi:hypothetical protein
VQSSHLSERPRTVALHQRLLRKIAMAKRIRTRQRDGGYHEAALEKSGSIRRGLHHASRLIESRNHDGIQEAQRTQRRLTSSTFRACEGR